VSERRFFILAHETARKRAQEAIGSAPDGSIVEIRPQTRRLAQNALLHAELQEVADTREWAGQKQDIEVWKRLLTAAWMRARGDQIMILPALDGAGVDIVFRRTSELTIAECSELVEFIRAWKETE